MSMHYHITWERIIFYTFKFKNSKIKIYSYLYCHLLKFTFFYIFNSWRSKSIREYENWYIYKIRKSCGLHWCSWYYYLDFDETILFFMHICIELNWKHLHFIELIVRGSFKCYLSIRKKIFLSWLLLWIWKTQP